MKLNRANETISDFKDAFSHMFGVPPALCKHRNILKASWLETKIGSMIAISDNDALYLLEFVNRRGLEREVLSLKTKVKSAVILGDAPPIRSIENELNQYFNGKLSKFNTPLYVMGTPFQNRVFEELQKIPYGETISYADLAKAIGQPSACRAVAQANGANQHAIIIPCHRVINTGGELGGYAGGLEHKKWLINHEKRR